MYEIKQSTSLTLPFFVHDSAGDAITSLTDGSFTKRISKGSGAFGAMTVTITEMENGWYSIPLSTSHSDTLGLLTITFTNAGAKQINLQWRVEAKLVDDLNDFNSTSDDVAVVTLVTTTTTNTDMRGTDSAATEAKQDIIDTNIDQIETAVITNAAGVDISADIAALKVVADAIPTTAMRGTDNAATEAKQDIIDTNIDQIEVAVITNAAGVDISADVAALKVVADAIPTTAMRGTDSAALASEVAKVPKSDGVVTWNSTALASVNAECDTAITDYDGPTNAEMNARTLVAASYFDPASDAVANVTLCATTTTNTDMVAAPASVFTTQMSESYSTAGVAPTMAQSLFMIQQALTDFNYAGTVWTIRKIDGATTAATGTLDSASSPTDNTRAS